MQLDIDLGFKETDTKKVGERVRKAQTGKADRNYVPTWQEVWITGWTRHTGTVKKGIFQTKLTDLDKKRLTEVKEGIESGTIPVGVDDLRKFSKSHALGLYSILRDKNRAKVVEEMLQNFPDNYHCIQTEEQLDWVAGMMELEQSQALDTETTGLEWEDMTIGMSITFPEADQHVYIPYAHITDEPQLSRETVMSKLGQYLSDPERKLYLFNATFDFKMLLKDGVDIQESIYFDALIAMHVLNENEPTYRLKDLANKYGKFFGYTDESLTFEELFGRDPAEFRKADLKLATIYACKDTHLTWLLSQWQLSMMEKQPKLKHVYFEVEQGNTQVAIEMERNGFAVDQEFAKQYAEELSAEIKELEKRMQDNWGDININSPKQLAEKFYDELGYGDVSGKRSVNAETLKRLAEDHEEVADLLTYRDLNKLLSTYVEPLPKLVHKDTVSNTGDQLKGDNRLHGSFKQTGTVTGRWSSSEPNLQNLSQRARQLIIAPEGKLMIGIDYSQIEPRTLASMSGDEGLQEPYLKGIDMYSTLASRIFKIPYENCLEADDTTWREIGMAKHPRKLMKVGLLAVMYGISVPTLSKQLGISKAEAQKFMDDFYNTYPQMTRFMEEQVAHADKYGYTETMNGRKRRFIGHTDIAKQYHALQTRIKGLLGHVPDNVWETDLPYKLKREYGYTKSRYARTERMSVNAVIQGSASEILKKAMIAVYRHLKNKDGWKLLATIHDELLFEIPATATPEEIRELESIMTGIVKLEIPIKCDVEVMARWGAGIPLQEWVDNGCGREQFEQ